MTGINLGVLFPRNSNWIQEVRFGLQIGPDWLDFYVKSQRQKLCCSQPKYTTILSSWVYLEVYIEEKVSWYCAIGDLSGRITKKNVAFSIKITPCNEKYTTVKSLI